MTRPEDLCHPETVRVAAAHQAEAENIAAELAAIAATGMILPGSITERRTRCGRSNRACHADPPRDYQPWIDNDRRLHELLSRLEALGTAALDADPRWERQSRRPARTGTEGSI